MKRALLFMGTTSPFAPAPRASAPLGRFPMLPHRATCAPVAVVRAASPSTGHLPEE
ncbi:MAG TPA: hypothetical protein PLJ27_07605 [Polyangiaceae bacterium]|nr:hypothetical protein [Polyangiaceae bacterium]HOD22009.1 hypothetical protein [Polyangiaceae bacterium]HOE47975.1 hypothetical protein [Polyangiaceae bacterium]HOR35484.1 hypothetical protein [Polyangiaceae bacterium]HOT08933.1 hypothetical protein [Polyangiaceae bacterium]